MYLQVLNYNNKNGVYNFYHFLIKKKKKIIYFRFLPKIVTICFREKKGFNCKNNYKYN